MDKIILKNGIKVDIKTNKNTPRTAIVMHIRYNKNNTGKKSIYSLLSSLLFQGTKSTSAEQLAQELDENAIDIYYDLKADYMRFKILCLNEDVNLALNIFQDMFENSTLDNYEKEIQKIKGDLISELDSAKAQAKDEYLKTVYKNHQYAFSRKDAIEELETVTKEDLFEVFEQLKYIMAKNIFVVSDKTKEEILPLIEKHFEKLGVKETEYDTNLIEEIKENRVSTIIKDDANQAQIYMGWAIPIISFEEWPIINLVNTILGSAGLSSRLFLELREKKGLAYTVRSSYAINKLGSDFYVYIATEPKNIKTSIEGFQVEINKIMTEPMSSEELENAKNNAIGKRQFLFETNMSEAIIRGLYKYWGVDYDYEQKFIESVKEITKEDIMNFSKKYFSAPTALCVLAPEKYLKESGLI
ncbi:MAG: M16 family metallopeptidase [Candidatus Avigastranaerophilus sp.]